jgi:dTDP-4-dehydrorhamnose 3,5-epimerase-like enzyme
MADSTTQTINIAGLQWHPNWRIPNGEDSYVVPFPTLRPATLVFHGDEKFDYGHYGIHLGQADVLTFLGPSDQTITGYFIDCREGSETAGQRDFLTWTPDSGRALRIPPGVAHAFEGLEGVDTLNTYELFLPSPEAWLGDSTEWRADSDIINLPMDVADEDVPLFAPNVRRASDVWYQIVAAQQRKAIPLLEYEYPFTQDVTTDAGENVRVQLRKSRASATDRLPEWEPISSIDGLGWAAHPVLWSGAQSGFVPLLDALTLYAIDHGESGYTHDAYGIHLGQEDHLTFVGPTDHEVTVHFMDCRAGSPTLNNETSVVFTPNALRYLSIPPGVGHRFENIERVFTINRPKSYVPASGEYEPGNDVVDWPAEQRPGPALAVNGEPAELRFYQLQVAAQVNLQKSPASHDTPSIVMAETADGETVRVAFRKPSVAAAS